MSGDQHVLVGAELRRHVFVPVRLHALQSGLQRLGRRQIVDARIARVVRRVARVGRLQRGRRDVVAATPDLDLVRAVLGRRLRLVEPGQRAIVTLVQAPRALDRDPHQVQLVEDDPQGAYGPFQHGRVGDVEREVQPSEQLPGRSGLAYALLGQIDVVPPGEQVLQVPLTLSVAAQHQFSGHRSSPGICEGG